MDSTHLDLLTRDGKVSVTFWPSLDAEHYQGLVELSTQCYSSDELHETLKVAARAWFRDVQFE
jgi:hypothetical protein